MPFRCCRPTDATYREVGLNLAAATMRRGERCRLWAPPAYGYGDRGSFSFPTVPPGAHLVYDLELLDWEDPEEERDRASLTYEERLEAAERRRQDGNALYGEGRYAEAERKYRLAVSYINEDLLIQLGDFHFDKAVAVRRPAQLNIAACQLRLGDLHGAVATCSEVLAEDGGNAKALFRRGKARAALGQGDAALADLAKAAAAAPEDVGIARELAAVRRTLKQVGRPAWRRGRLCGVWCQCLPLCLGCTHCSAPCRPPGHPTHHAADQPACSIAAAIVAGEGSLGAVVQGIL